MGIVKKARLLAVGAAIANEVIWLKPQLKKALSSIDTTELPMVKLPPEKPLQARKASILMDVTASGIVKLPVKPLHSLKAEFSMVATELPRVKLPVKPVQR